MWGCFLLVRELRLAVYPGFASSCACFWSGLTAHGALRLTAVTGACSMSWSKQQLPWLLQSQIFVHKWRDVGEREPASHLLGGQPFVPSQCPAVTAFSLLSPQQHKVMMGGDDAAAGSMLGASPRLCGVVDVLLALGVMSPVENWLLQLIPALQGTELLLQGQGEGWQNSWQAARLLQLIRALCLMMSRTSSCPCWG